MQSSEVCVAEASDVAEGDRKIVSLGHTDVGIYRLNGRLYAYENRCPHQGGPACEGLVMPKVEDVLGPDRTYRSRRFNYDEWHIVCPWHAWEYDLATGQCIADRRYRLRRYDVVERDGRIYVVRERHAG